MICFRLEGDRKIAEHQIHELQARLDEVEANALKNGKKAAAKLEVCNHAALISLLFTVNLNFSKTIKDKTKGSSVHESE